MAKKKSSNNVMIIIGGILLGVLLIGSVLWFINSQPKSVNLTSDDGFITVRLYDENKNLITTGTEQSIVQGVSGVNYIDLTVTATNTGTEPLTCDIITLTPTAFDTAVTKTTKTVPTTSPAKASWTSSLIDVTPFEQPSPATTRFETTVRCSYNTGTQTVVLSDKTGFIDLSIEPESGTASFSVSVDTGGTPTEFCGDSICQANEDAISCPADCAVSANVNYRTTDLSYVSGSAVGYTASCGSALTAYGYEADLNGFSGSCGSDSDFGAILQAGLVGNVNGGDDGLTLYADASDPDEVWVCDESDNGGVTHTKVRYDSTDSDASSLDTSALSFDSDKELSC